MKVFSTFFRIIWKYKKSVILYIAIFAGLSLVFGAMAGDSTKQAYEESNVSIAVIDHDQTKASEALYSYLDEIHTIVEVEDNEDAKLDAFFDGKVYGIIEIESGFEDGLYQNDLEGKIVAYNNPAGSGNTFVSMQAQAYASSLSNYLIIGYDMEEAIQKTEANLAMEAEIGFVSEDSGKEYTQYYYYFLYLTYALVSIIIFALCPVFIRFRQKDLKDRMDCAAFPAGKRSGALAAGAITFGLGVFTLIIVMSIVAYHNIGGFFGSLGYYALNVFVNLLVTISIALLLSNFIDSINILSVFANIIGLGLSFISGVFVPQELLSEGVLTVAKCFPTYWYVEVVSKIHETSGNLVFADVSMGLLIQLLYAVALFSLSLVTVKYKKA
ncbi:MAG: ABC transporter permease [Lachnospiraceae bacterium]|nr:ABC transporter permease [Lachnospiraceae bacterium]